MIMRSSSRLGGWIGILLLSGIASCLSPSHQVWGDARTGPNGMRGGNAEAGRNVFNGKGVCYYCHGVDGRRGKLPQLEPGTVALIAQLKPQPADLRNPRALKLKTEKARAKVIREGHEGTGMFPDTRMTDHELADTVAYLAVLRKEGHAKKP